MIDFDTGLGKDGTWASCTDARCGIRSWKSSCGSDASNLLLRGPGSMVCTATPPFGVNLMLPHKQRVATGERCALKLPPLRLLEAGSTRLRQGMMSFGARNKCEVVHTWSELFSSDAGPVNVYRVFDTACAFSAKPTGWSARPGTPSCRRAAPRCRRPASRRQSRRSPRRSKAGTTCWKPSATARPCLPGRVAQSHSPAGDAARRAHSEG